MKMQEIRTMLRTSEDYDFLKTNPHLGGRIILVTVGGSHAYGLERETSDVDIRGITLELPSDIIGLSRFEQVVEEKTDTVIYGFNKICELMLKCNPNTIELLGNPRGYYFYLHPIGAQLLDNRKMFISKRCVETFGGYAVSQLRRIENALARDRLSSDLRERHIRESMEGAIKYFKERYTSFEYGMITLNMIESTRYELSQEIGMNAHLEGFPARQFNSMINDLKNVLDAYDNLNNRNKKKDDDHMNKHAMHLVRLYLSCINILETGDIHTLQDWKTREFLKEIRDGKYMNADGTYQDEFFQMVKDLEKQLQYAKNNTDIPEEPDKKKIEEFMMYVNRGIITHGDN